MNVQQESAAAIALTPQKRPQEPETSSSKVAKMEAAKHLVLSIVEYGDDDVLHFSIKSLQLSNLFSKQYHDDSDSVLNRTFLSWEEMTLKYGMGMVCASDGTLYVVAHGFHDGNKTAEPSPTLKMLKFSLSPLGGIGEDLGRMRSAKAFPIVVEINQLIYVLSRPFKTCSEPLGDVFEVYDPSKRVWKVLSPPPFMGLLDEDFPCEPPTSYVVMNKYLCVTSMSMSCAFDTVKEEWQACELFRNFYKEDHVGPIASQLFKHYSSFCKSYSLYDPEPVACGPPFPFLYDALIYGDFLICKSRDHHLSNVVAFKIIDGKVGKSEILLSWSDMKPDATDFMLVDLGCGDFCLLYRGYEELHFTKFKVMKSAGDGGLTCATDVEVSTLHLNGSPGQRWHFFGASAL